MNENPAGLKSKPHYEILDGLRGVAAIIVLAFHLLEAHAANAFTQIIKHAFWVCSGLIAIILAMPRIGGPDHVWMNGLYEAFCIIVLFPLIVALGAGGSLKGKCSTRICGFLGDISYPLYITHYPLIYLYTAWVGDKHLSLAQSYPGALLVFLGSFALAYACLILYDEPFKKLA